MSQWNVRSPSWVTNFFLSQALSRKAVHTSGAAFAGLVGAGAPFGADTPEARQIRWSLSDCLRDSNTSFRTSFQLPPGPGPPSHSESQARRCTQVPAFVDEVFCSRQHVARGELQSLVIALKEKLCSKPPVLHFEAFWIIHLVLSPPL